ncbi:metal-dependent hydrolase [Pseudoruegeria sp. SHC-113]|uniref:metal-dependent hydrolase n=1 Tax=Pseudoruegeria sp. SHC-113 TaxID=2855439 RepID=UPI0021BB89A8|nr:metal-dependent hydrolase [Pseudoruegeria sp. SHC-113]MCT8159603.1 metal-dependent hydrolase [Pseudoruegeria sp. SHC-113]
MNIIWLGHSGFRIEIGDQVLLVDPWLTGNPMFPAGRRAEAVSGATHILITHGHGDHAGDALALSKELSAPLVGIYDLMSHWEASEGVTTVGFNKGGTVALGDVAVSMVNAVHSSSLGSAGGPIYAGAEAGFMIRGEGRTVYVSGDTDVMADMAWMGEYYTPDIGILCAGGHFTMDMRAAAFAARTFFDFEMVIPCHYRTFPLLAQDAEELKAGLPGVTVVEPEVLEAIRA